MLPNLQLPPLPSTVKRRKNERTKERKINLLSTVLAILFLRIILKVIAYEIQMFILYISNKKHSKDGYWGPETWSITGPFPTSHQNLSYRAILFKYLEIPVISIQSSHTLPEDFYTCLPFLSCSLRSEMIVEVISSPSVGELQIVNFVLH